MISSVFILGAGGHAKVLVDCLSHAKDVNLKGFLDNDPGLHGKKILGYKVLGNDDVLTEHPNSEVCLINGIGSIGRSNAREKIFNYFKQKGYNFLSVKHPFTYIGSEVILKEGVQLFAGCIIQPNCFIGNNVIVNTNASIDHDCHIDDHAHIAPGAICCGGVTIGKGTHIGSGAVILQGITIGNNCLIGAGAVVTRNVASTSKVVGIPAKLME